jgi:hypothetical protein
MRTVRREVLKSGDVRGEKMERKKHQLEEISPWTDQIYEGKEPPQSSCATQSPSHQN